MKAKRVRIYLGHDNETKKGFNKEDVINFFNKYLDGYTIINTSGLYLDNIEESYIIEYLQMNFVYLSGIRFYKNMIRDAEKHFKQDVILWTYEEVEAMK